MKKYNDFLCEMVFPEIPTQFKLETSDSMVVDINFDSNYKDYKYTFVTKNKNSYSVYFLMTKEKISDDIIPTILFSETKNGLDSLYFNNLTNANEFAEVMGKVIYLIKHFMLNNHFDIYSIGTVSDKKQNFYNYYKYHFNDFNIKEDVSINYPNKLAYYLIKKQS